jgi:hypothetical protein
LDQLIGPRVVAGIGRLQVLLIKRIAIRRPVGLSRLRLCLAEGNRESQASHEKGRDSVQDVLRADLSSGCTRALDILEEDTCQAAMSRKKTWITSAELLSRLQAEVCQLRIGQFYRASENDTRLKTIVWFSEALVDARDSGLEPRKQIIEGCEPRSFKGVSRPAVRDDEEMGVHIEKSIGLAFGLY